MFSVNNKKRHNGDNNRNKLVKFLLPRFTSLFPPLLASLFFILPAKAACAKNSNIIGMIFGELQWQMCRAEMTTEKETPLMKAAEEGNTKKVQELIAAGAEVNAVYGEHYVRTTALLEAVKEGHTEVVKLLLDAGAKPDLKDGECNTALMYAVNMDNAQEMVRLLLEAGASPRTKNLEGENALGMVLQCKVNDNLLPFLKARVWLSSRQKNKALSMAVCQDMETFKAAIEAGARPKEETLLKAAQCGQADIVRFLISKKININARDSMKEKAKTPLMWAAENGHLEVVQALTSAGAEIDARALPQESWERVYYHDSKEKSKFLAGETALVLAIRASARYEFLSRKLAVIQALLQAGADVNINSWKYEQWDLSPPSSKGYTPLIIAAETWCPPEVIKALIAAGADLKARHGKQVMDILLCNENISEDNDVELVRELIKAGANVNTRCDYNNYDKVFTYNSRHGGETPLMVAARGGSAEIVQMLIDAGADVNAQNEKNNNQTALILATREGHAEVVKVLLAAGADKTARLTKEEHKDIFKADVSQADPGYTLLMLAFMPLRGSLYYKEYTPHPQVIKALIEAGVDVNAQNIKGETALYLAAKRGDTEAVKMLLAAGAEVNTQDNYNKETPLNQAARRDHTEIVKALIAAGADVNAKDEDNSTALMSAAYCGKIEIVQMLLAAGADVNAQRYYYNSTALMDATDCRRTETVKALIAAGADVNAKNKNNDTALMLASNGDYSGLRGFANEYYKAYTEIALALIAAGADVNIKNKDDETALIRAINNGYTEIALALIKAGADVSAKDDDNETALMRATSRDNAEIVRALIAAGADVNAKDNKTLLMKAAYQKNTEIVRVLIAAGADVNAKGYHNGTALMSAVGNAETLQMLIAAGADVNAKDDDNETALMRAVYNAEIVQMLIAAGADVNAKDDDNDTALMRAARWGHTKTVRVLLAAGADVNAKNNDNKTALDMAQTDEIAALLRRAKK